MAKQRSEDKPHAPHSVTPYADDSIFLQLSDKPAGEHERSLPRSAVDVLRYVCHEFHYRPNIFGLDGTVSAQAARAVADLLDGEWSQRPPDGDLVGELLHLLAEHSNSGGSVVDGWRTKEIVLNERFNLALALMGPKLRGRFFKKLLGDGGRWPHLRLVRKDDLKIHHTMGGHPDTVLTGTGTLLFVEMKVKGGRFSADQYEKYLHLAWRELFRSDLVESSRCRLVLIGPKGP